MRIFIVGLRRSGTTIFWDTLRQDRRLHCYNEPFNPALRQIPIEIPNRSRREFIDLFRREPRTFWRTFAPIGRIEELQDDLSDRQVTYLKYLMTGTEWTCMDETRCHFRLEALRNAVPDTILVHLFREPVAFASSHMIPTSSSGFHPNRLVGAYAQVGFFTRLDRYNNWGMEELVGRHPESLFGHRLREIGMDPEVVYQLPAVARLLAFWRVAYETVERDGPRLFGARFVSVPFEHFCEDPSGEIERIYRAAGEKVPSLDFSRVKRASPGFRPEDPRWRELLEQVGLWAEPGQTITRSAS